MDLPGKLLPQGQRVRAVQSGTVPRALHRPRRLPGRVHARCNVRMPNGPLHARDASRYWCPQMRAVRARRLREPRIRDAGAVYRLFAKGCVEVCAERRTLRHPALSGIELSNNSLSHSTGDSMIIINPQMVRVGSGKKKLDCVCTHYHGILVSRFWGGRIKLLSCRRAERFCSCSV